MLNIVLDVVIGLVFIYLLYSLLATAIQEALATILHRRANILYRGIKSMLSDTPKTRGLLPDTVQYLSRNLWINLWQWFKKTIKGKPSETLYDQFYDHPIIKSYGQNILFKKPSYLSADNFAAILVETIKNLDPANKDKPASFAMVQETIQAKQAGIHKDTIIILTYHLNEAAGDLNVFKYRLGKWYDDTMDRVSGWYKRNTQFWLFLIGISLAITLNIDSVEISNTLSDNKAAREQLAKMGEAAAANPNRSGKDSVIAQEVLDSIKADLTKVNTLVGLGWGDYGRTDANFRKYYLSDTIRGNDTSKVYKAFLANKDSAETLVAAATEIFLANVKAGNDSARFQKISDSLGLLRNDQVLQQQFAMLYNSEKFDSSLKRQYVLGYRLWSPRLWLGFLITAFAIGLGAPFWFDLLNKFVSLRSAVKSVNSSGSTTKNNNANTHPEIEG